MRLLYPIIAASCLLALLAGCSPRDPLVEVQAAEKDPEKLREYLGHDNPDARFWARMYLMRMGKPAVPHLVQAAEEGNDHARAEATAGLCGMAGIPREEAIPVLIKACSDPNPTTRMNAVQALRSIGPAARESLPALRAALKDENHRVRTSAVVALPRVAGADAVPDLKAALKDRQLQSYAADSLAQLGPQAKDAVPELEELANTTDQFHVRLAAQQALTSIQKQEH